MLKFIIGFLFIWIFFTGLFAFTYVEVFIEQSFLRTWWRFFTFRIYYYK